MKYSAITILILISLFLTCLFVGLGVNKIYLEDKLPYGMKTPEVEKEFSPLYLISALVFVGVFFYLIKKFEIPFIMGLWFLIAITVTMSITLSAFIEGWIALLVAISIAILRYRTSDLFVHNLSEILIYGGIVAIFSPLFSVLSAIILLVAISIYDFVAVFITKHMVKLVETQKSSGIFTGLLVRYKDENAVLGGGDIAFPMLFAVVLMREISILPAIFSIYGAAIGLIALILIGKKEKYYPALPFVGGGAIIGFLLSTLI